MAAGDEDVRQSYQAILDDHRAPTGANPSEVVRAAKWRRRLSERYHEMGRINDGELAEAYVSESAAMDEFVTANAPAVVAPAAPLWFGPAIAAVLAELATIKADLASVKTDVATIKADVTSVKADVAEIKADLASVKAQAYKN